MARMDRAISSPVSAGKAWVTRGPTNGLATPWRPRTQAGGWEHGLWLRKALALGGIRKDTAEREGLGARSLSEGSVAPLPLWVVLSDLLPLSGLQL